MKEQDLQYARSKKLLKENGPKKNDPILHKPRLMPYIPSEDEQMQRSGVSPDQPAQVDLYRDIEQLKLFSQRFSRDKDKPLPADYKSLLPVATNLYASRAAVLANAKLLESIDDAVSGFYSVVSRLGSKLPRVLQKSIITISRAYIDDPLYIPKEFEFGEMRTSTFMHAPNPRIDATLALLHLLSPGGKDGIAQQLIPMMWDKSAAIRFRIASVLHYFWKHHPEETWKQVQTLCLLENEGFVLQIIIRALTWDDTIQSDQHRVEVCLLLLEMRFAKLTDKGSHELWSGYVFLLLRMVLRYKSAVAEEIIKTNYALSPFCRTIILQVLTDIDPHGENNDYVHEPDRHAWSLQLWKEILLFRFQAIIQKGLNSKDLQDDFEIIDSSVEHLYHTMSSGRKANRKKPVEQQNMRAFYAVIKPLIVLIVDESEKLGDGFMVAHTGYYFMQLLNFVFEFDPEFALRKSSRIVKCAASGGFTYDQTTLREIVKLTERLLVDHKEILFTQENFNSLILMLDMFANSGWQEALELTWRLKEIF